MGRCYSSLKAASYCVIVTSGRIGFHSALFELLLFLLFEVMLAVYVICTASHYGFLGCRLKC